ncbi:MAG TPA: phospholipase D-like domain-containing protein [Puia sp.]|nr:phospholipase D-like domain-containing protein [Puia sp.]
MISENASLISAGYSADNRIEFIHGGREYFRQLLKMIDEAKETIHLQTYIYVNDVTGKQVADALKQAAARHVEVYLLVDGYASQELAPSFIYELEQSGIHFRFFEPIFKSKYYYFGRRLHHKLVVTDTRNAMVGGINISDNYNDMPGKPAWLDFAIYVEGEIARELCVLCWKTWKSYPARMGLTPCEEKKLDFDFRSEESSWVRMRRNDWVRRKNQVSKSYLGILHQARSEIIIVSSYFLPGKEFRKKIAEAAQRGVKVKLVLAGVSDVAIAKQAERHMYRWLLKNNIEIFEYRPAVLHGKMAICDEQWMTIGSYNVNNISAFASIELNIDIMNERFVRHVKESMQTIIETDCSHITANYFTLHNHFVRRAWQEICYELIRVIFFLFTFYFSQKEK